MKLNEAKFNPGKPIQRQVGFSFYLCLTYRNTM